MPDITDAPQQPKPSSAAQSGKEAYDAMMKRRREAAAQKEAAAADAEMYHVPTLAVSVAERGAEVNKLWKTLLSGKRGIVLSGIDGMGKSTAVGELCDAVRKTKRFSCVQWFNARYHLRQQLETFVRAMKGRKESDVLLVFDDVPRLRDVADLVASLEKFATVVITSSEPAVSPSAAIPSNLHVVPLEPLSADGCRSLAQPFEISPQTADAVGALVGRVPLLVELSFAAVQRELLGDDAVGALRKVIGAEEGVLSVSKATMGLVQLIVDRVLVPVNPDALKILAILACFQLNDLSVGHISQLPQPSAADLAVAASEALLLKNRWQDDVFTMHPTIASALTQLCPDAPLVAAEALLAMWPRRWRNMGMGAVQSLVWHTVALHETFRRLGVAPTPALLTSMERAATFLCHGESKDLAVAAAMWSACLDVYRASPAPPPNMPDLAAELGKTLLVLRDPRAPEVLRFALDAVAAASGQSSVKHALVLSFYAPYAQGPEWPPMMERAAAVLSSHAQGGGDETLFEEEVIMYKEAEYVLLATRAEMLRPAGGGAIDAVVVQELKTLAAEIASRKAAHRANTATKRASRQ